MMFAYGCFFAPFCAFDQNSTLILKAFFDCIIRNTLFICCMHAATPVHLLYSLYFSPLQGKSAVWQIFNRLSGIMHSAIKNRSGFLLTGTHIIDPHLQAGVQHNFHVVWAGSPKEFSFSSEPMLAEDLHFCSWYYSSSSAAVSGRLLIRNLVGQGPMPGLSLR